MDIQPQNTSNNPGDVRLSGTTIGFADPQKTGVQYTAPSGPTPVATSPAVAPVQNPPTPPVAPVASGPPGSNSSPPWKRRGVRGVIKPIIIGLIVIALLLSGAFVLWQRTRDSQKKASLSNQEADATTRFDPMNLPLGDLIKAGQISIESASSLSINGQLKLNNSLTVNPSNRPTNPVAGQIYFDKAENTLQYYNGTEFIPLGSQTIVQSIGGLSGLVQLGDTLTAANGELNVAASAQGVQSLQGQTGNVSLTSGGGISISGTTLTNTGVLSVGGLSGAIEVGAGLSAADGTIKNSGVISASSGSASIVVTNDGNGNITISNVGAGTGTVTSGGGTSGRIAKFTGTQNIEDSLLSESGSVITVNGDLQVTGSLALGTLLSVANGGTGTASLANNGVLIGQGTGPITSVTAAGSGLCLLSTAGAPSFQACPSAGVGVDSLNGLTGNLTVANASASGATITIDDASTTQKGIAQFNATNFTVSAGAVNTIQAIDASATPTFAGINTNAITPSSALTVGATTQDLTLQGANTLVTRTNGANTTTLSFAAPTANVTYRLQTAAAGTYDVCTTVGNCTGIGGAVTTTGGTTNRLAKFTGSQAIGDSLISDNGTVVTVNGNLSVTGTTTLTTPLAVTSGGTGANNAASARTNLGAASSGANSDISSLSGLTTALSVVQGGTGATSLTTNGVLLGNGTSAISSLVAGAPGQCLVSTAGAPVWQACPGSGGVTSINSQTGVVTVANASGAGGTITLNDASTSQKGIAQFNATNFSASGGVINTIQAIDSTATPTFAAVNTNAITPSGALTVGATTQDVTLQGANTLITSTSGASTTTLSFAAPTANVTYRLQTAAAGTYDVCTTVGNCTGIGGAVTTAGGTTNRLAKFTGSQAIGDSLISDNGTVVTVNGNLSVTGTTTLSTPLAITSGGTGANTAAGARTNLGAASSGANSDITSLSGLTTALSVVQGGTGATSLTTNGVLLGNGTSAISSLVAGAPGECLISTAGAPVWQACPGSGGVTSINGQTGVVTVANASGAAGTVTIDNASTSQKGIAQFNATNFTASTGIINTAQDINVTASPTFGRLTLTSSQASNPMLLVNNTNASATGNLIDLQLNGSSRFAVTPSGNMTVSGTVNGQTISSTASFTGTLTVAGAANLNGGATVTGTLTANTITPTSALTVGATNQSFLMQGNSSSTITATSGANTTTVAFQAPTASVTYRLLTAAAGTYDICTTAGNCAGVGGGVTTPGGTTNTIPKFTGAQTLGDSIITDNGSTVTIGGALAVNTITPSGAMTIGATGQNLTLQGAVTRVTATAGGITNTLTFATPSGSNKTITIPNASGTVAVSASGPLQIDASGNLSCPTCTTTGGGGGGAVDSLNGQNGTVTLDNATGAAGVITIDDASTSQKGIAQFNSTNFSVSGGVVNTIQDIDITATPTFAGINTNAITPSGALTVGATTQDVTLQGANTLITSTNGANTTTLSFAAATADVTYRLQTAAAGTYDVCTTVGNCTGIGGAVTTAGGTTNQLAKFTAGQVIGDSLISDDGSIVTVSGNLSVTGTTTLSTPLAVTSGGTGANTASGARSNLGAASSGANSDITSLSGLTTALSVVQGGTGAVSLTTNGVLLGNGTSAISSLVAGAPGQCLVSTAGAPTWQSCPGSGGVTSINSQTGVVTVANASGSGGTITLNDASTSQKGIAQFNSTNFSAASGVINTAQDINTTATPTFARLTVTSSQASSPMLLVNNTNAAGTGNLIDLQLNGASRFSVTPAGNMTVVGTVNGQTISSAASFTGTLAVAGAANLNGGATVTGTLTANTITPTSALTVGATNQSFLMQGNSSSTITATSGANTTTVAFQTPTASVSYRLLTAAAGTYDICTTAGNCVGAGGGVTTPGGTTNALAKFTGSQVIGDSIITDNGTTVTVGGTLAVNTITPSGAMTIGATGQTLALQGSDTTLSETAGGITNTLAFATPSGSNKTITVPNASGTVAVSASGALAVDASGNISCATCVTGSVVSSLNSQTGSVSVANASGSGGVVTIDDASTSQKGIAQFNSTNFSVSGGTVNTIQDINTTAAPTFGRLTVTSSQASSDLFTVNNTNVSGTGSLLKLQLNGANRFTVDPAGNVVAAGTITSGAINGQTISSAANFTGTMAVAGLASLNGGATVTGTLTANTITPTASMTVGATTQNLTLQGAATTVSATSGANTTTLSYQTPTANVTYRLLTAAAGTYDVCTTVGNCTGLGGAVTSPGGTTGKIAKFTGANTIGDSLLSESGSVVTVAGNLNLTTGSQYRINGTQISSADLSNDANLAKLNATQTFTGATNTFSNASNSTSAFSIQNALGRNLLNADTTNSIFTFGNVTASVGAGVAGTIRLADGTSDNFGMTLNTTTLTASRTISLPDAAGTICLQSSASCGFVAGSSADFIQNQNAGDQSSANFRISGTGRAATALQAPLIDTPTAAVLNIGTTNATSIALNKATAVTGTLTQSGGTFTIDGNNNSSISTNSGTLTVTSTSTATWSVTSGTLNLQANGTSNRLELNGASNIVTLHSGGTLNLGSSNTTTTNLGAISNNARTINIGIGTGGSQAQTVVIGSLGGTSTVTMQGGSGAGAIALSTGTNGSIGLTTAGTGSINFSTNSSTSKFLFQSNTNSTTALQVKNALGLNDVFNVDTTNSRVGVNMSNPSYTLDVFGDANVGALSNYRVGGTIICNSGGCTPGSGSANYIQNQSATSQTASWRVTGTGRADTALQSPSLDTASAAALTIGTTNASSITIGKSTVGVSAPGGLSINSDKILNFETGTNDVQAAYNSSSNILSIGNGNTSGIMQLQGDVFRVQDTTGFNNNLTISNTGATVFKNRSNSVTAFQIQGSANSTSLFNADTTNERIGIGTNAPRADLDVGRDGGKLTIGGNGSGGFITFGNEALQNGIQFASNELSVFTTQNNGFSIYTDYDLDTANAEVRIAANGSALFRNNTNSTTAFEVQNTGGVQQLVVDSSNSRVYVGPLAGSTTPTLLVLSNKTNAGDPTGVAGAMYYNSSTSRFRCYEGASWKDCLSRNDYTPAFIGTNATPNGEVSLGTSNRAWFVATTVPVPVTVTGVKLYLGVSSGNIDVGLYDNSGTRLASSGSVASPGANQRTVNFSSSVAIEPGIYYLAIAANNTTATFARFSNGNLTMGVNYFDSAFPLPSSVTLPGTFAGTSTISPTITGIVSGGVTQ